ncbi:MAG: glycosyltransferase family 39 protein [Deltaproteobacteria bacterium]|nr:glycosyltransferase family 39 protein [Deltaproteobacteria bacterium]MBW2361157.1 glycosyltransferase family 39 protein [Deltaproteobacteria bacterium]
MPARRLAPWLALALLAGSVRWGAFETAQPVALLGDENYYVEVADNLARGRGHLYVGQLEGEARAWRPPGHAWLLSLGIDTQRPAREAPELDTAVVARLQRSQIWLGTALVLLTAALGRSLFDARSGWLAGGLAALYPALIAHSHYLWSETWFSVQLLAALWAAVKTAERPGPAGVVATGLAFGVAALTREQALVAAAACGLWWLSEADGRRAALVRATAMLALAFAVTLPWMARNHTSFGRWIGISTVGWFAAAEGNSLESPEWWRRRGPVQGQFHADYFSTRNEGERLDLAREHAIARIVAEQPAWLFKKSVRNLALLANPDSVVRTKVRNGAYGDRPAAPARWLLAASTPAWLALASCAALGIAASRAGGRRLLAVLLLGAVAALHIATNATPRFRVPWLPLLCVYAAHAVWLGRGLFARLDRRGLAGAGIALVFLFGVALPYYWMWGGRP